MGIIEINKQPSRQELRWFGLVVLAFLALVGVLTLWRTGSWQTAVLIWAFGSAVTAGYYLVPALQRPLYVGWMYAVFPVGWVVSHLLLAGIFYLVVTPIGAALRLLGHDPLQRSFDRSARTYWTPHDPGGEVRRYFKQF